MIEHIHKLIKEAEAFNTQSLDEVEAFRIRFLGKKGLLTDLFAGFKEVPNEQKKDLAFINHDDTVCFKTRKATREHFEKLYRVCHPPTKKCVRRSVSSWYDLCQK